MNADRLGCADNSVKASAQRLLNNAHVEMNSKAFFLEGLLCRWFLAYSQQKRRSSALLRIKGITLGNMGPS